MKEENIKAVEMYLDALRRQDLTIAPLADDVIFQNPMVGHGRGAEKLCAFLSGFLPAIKTVTVVSHICENDMVATRWTTDTVFGTIEIADFFRIENGKIVEAYGYFDPRPLFG